MRDHGRPAFVSTGFLAAVALSLSLVRSAEAGRDDPSGVLTFEACGAARSLAAWHGTPAGVASTTHLDSAIVHGGRFAGRLERRGDSPGEFSSIALSVPVDFAGDSVELRGWLKLEGVRGWAGLWQRQDGRSSGLPFDNMESRALSGSSDWREYSVTLPLDSRARTLVVGALIVGEGTVWVDDLELRIDGRPLLDAPERIALERAIDLDHEFDAGSRVSIGTPSSFQIESLVRLGKVWGFLKYHHPAIVRGTRHWDYDLFRVLPRFLAARDRAAADQALLEWIDGLGAVTPCDPCAAPPAEGPIRPRLEWLDDTRFAGPDLRDRLRRIHANRLAAPEHAYVGLGARAANPDFGSEAAYPGDAAPDEGFRLLALYRFWNIIEYWFPYRDLLEEDWDRVLREFVPRILAARSRDDYLLELIALSARVHDSHANLHASLHVLPPRGDCRLPVAFRPVGDRFVVAHTADSSGTAEGALQRGDIVVAFD
ncbi:MAG TPA: hypothetical protein VFM17_09510, partial [Candidatus Eisenbacteria bacterium]|nr:hypothetical protein [Candidatus Eisenbacteria bacterium]